ncbi:MULTISPECIES: AzlD domain-containing protein [unclassified Streptomyces]|uniref:AzlD domain-containing protein n=1 Tax=unclassified Streptomyces TaxID=2593676 RepID=UPI00225025AE|nr:MULTISPECIES: AzlD domain-containing protein [unclassified Streptomyces]MCX5050233.1 AzlD domain-containing protein [Streptomyces sp. NBC_00474]MCX5060610.1 AzlD domain-containing protein [Streptomyces sp. NBC_00452]MCX5248145.1 AzlD domain-containing protein [Streptomyces sp. NBC_00201]MCX5293800.1 AzlD domain-containing protein [Streptomyces sp. NBC_00183]
MTATVALILALAVGTYAFRLVGPVLHGRVELPDRLQELMAAGAVVLLVALLATGALTEGGAFAGWARPGGVLVAGVLAWRRAPFAVVVLGAAVTTAVLRMTGVG